MTTTADSFDAVVIGAGVVGASVAYHLARDGSSVILIDNRVEGRATPAGAGIVLPALAPDAAPDLDDLLLAASLAYPNLLDELELDGESGRHAVGAIALTNGDDAADAAERTAAALVRRRERGFAFVGDVEVLDGPATHARMPLLGTDHWSVWVGGAMWVDGPVLAESMIRSASLHHGLTVRHGTATVVPAAGAGGFSEVDVGGGRYSGAIVCAAGAWADGVVVDAGLRRFVVPERGQALHLRVAPLGRDLPVVLADTGYILATADGDVIVGSTHEPDSGFDGRPTVTGLTQLLGLATSLLPGIEQAAVARTRVGLRPASPDGLPTLGRLPGRQGVFVATGLGSYGLMGGAFAGALVADLVAGRPPRIDPIPFDPARWRLAQPEPADAGHPHERQAP